MVSVIIFALFRTSIWSVHMYSNNQCEESVLNSIIFYSGFFALLYVQKQSVGKYERRSKVWQFLSIFCPLELSIRVCELTVCIRQKNKSWLQAGLTYAGRYEGHMIFHSFIYFQEPIYQGQGAGGSESYPGCKTGIHTK